MKKPSLLLLSLALVMMVASPALGDEAEVDCEDNPYALEDAVDGADAGATLEIEGRCLGTITINKDLTIEGDDAVLDGDGEGPVVTIEAGVTVVLKDLKIQGGSGIGPRAIGGVDNWGDLTLRDVTVKGNVADAAGFLGFPHNIAVGGVHNEDSGVLTLYDSTVKHNAAASIAETGGGFFTFAVGGVSNRGSVTIVDSTLRGNDATGIGKQGADDVNVFVAGGVQSFGSLASLTVDDTTVLGNTAMASSASTLETVVVVAVGGVSNSSGAMNLTDVEVIANSGTKFHIGDGVGCGGIANDMTFDAPVNVMDSVIRNNQGSGWFAAGGVATIFSNVTIQDTAVTANEADAELYAVGGIDNHPGGTLTMIDGKVTENVAREGALFRTGGASQSNWPDFPFPGFFIAVDTTISRNIPNDCFDVEGCGA